MSVLEQIQRMRRIVEETPHQVVLTKDDDTTVILAEGSTAEFNFPWGKKVVTAEADGDFKVVTSGLNVSFNVERFGKLRRNSGVLVGESMISSEPKSKEIN